MPIDINAVVEVKRYTFSECPWGHHISTLSSLSALVTSLSYSDTFSACETGESI